MDSGLYAKWMQEGEQGEGQRRKRELQGGPPALPPLPRAAHPRGRKEATRGPTRTRAWPGRTPIRGARPFVPAGCVRRQGG